MLIGIDLGTTNSLVACYKDGKPQIIVNRLGKKITPSIVSIDENDHVLVGETAKEYGILHPDRTAAVFKRAMGTSKKFDLAEHSFSAEELSSFVLRSLKEDAEEYLKEKVDEAIISVPAYFNDKQRKATIRAGELAGLKVSRIINEPTASAIAYGVGEKGKSERCLVLDLGGGTFDVTVLEYYRNIMEVYAIAGDNFLGGEDFTQILFEMFRRDALVLDPWFIRITQVGALALLVMVMLGALIRWKKLKKNQRMSSLKMLLNWLAFLICSGINIWMQFAVQKSADLPAWACYAIMGITCIAFGLIAYRVMFRYQIQKQAE